MLLMAKVAPATREKAAEVLVALGLSIGAAVALGFSRFAYALLLPPMQVSLHWTCAEAGGMNTANAVGYVLGSALSAWCSRRLGIKRTFVLMFLVSALVLLCSGLVAGYGSLSMLRLAGGFATAVLFIVGASLATGIRPGCSPAWAGVLVSTYITGVGSGIVVSGVVVPPVLSEMGPPGWQAGWILLGCMAFLSLAGAVVALRAVPAQASPDSGALSRKEIALLWPTFAAYAFFGSGYVSYMTFIIVLLQQQGGSMAATALFWIVLGGASIVGTLLWGRLLGKIQSGKGPALVSLVVLAGALPVLLWPGLPAAFVSAFIFGGSFMAGPSSVTMIVRRLTPPHLATAAIGAMTVAFAVGQAIGPVLSGYVSDLAGTVGAGLWTAPVLLVVAAALAPLQRSR